MSDLLHGPEISGKPPENSVRKSPEFSISPSGKGTSGRAGVPLPGSPGTSDGGPFTTGKGNRRPKSGLREEASYLLSEIELAEVVRAAAERAQAPFRDAFRSADSALIGMLEVRRQGRFVEKATMLHGYDERVAAGHAWNPTRKHLQHTERWLKALRSELKNINMELDA